jgi:hypothetical protein
MGTNPGDLMKLQNALKSKDAEIAELKKREAQLVALLKSGGYSGGGMGGVGGGFAGAGGVGSANEGILNF